MNFPLQAARILEVRDVGIGERVCIDTASMLKTGEGLLVGSKANFLFLIHNESVGSSFTSPRPFRVNAGAVYCYTMLPDGKTKYLSEIESGAEVLIVNKEGMSRHAIVGRSKIETRPLRLVKAEMDGEQGSIILQNAETIRVVSKEGKLLSVTDLKVGNEILVHISRQAGRHFGLEVDEYVLEK
jgi:3-dehydroquinate synthase II